MEQQGASPSGSLSDSSGSQDFAYVPIRVLGRGAFGEAVLYRKVAVSVYSIELHVSSPCSQSSDIPPPPPPTRNQGNGGVTTELNEAFIDPCHSSSSSLSLLPLTILYFKLTG